ncbi:MAG: threonine synthase [Clostridiales bacterium]|nr:MAG: threonine synthase [Clostridiales bacterium]
MKYISTRNTDIKKTSAEAIKQGLAEDGGLFMPESIPQLSESDLKDLVNCTYPERAAKILSMYLTDYWNNELLQAAKTAYSAERFGAYPAPIKNLDEKHCVLELWHGPTAAFKDMALQIMPILLSKSLDITNEKRTALILVATSGDTGKAALEGYRDVEKIKIMVFYPNDGVSDIQKHQMASQEGKNVNVCSINGNFDDAQTGVKAIFSDTEIANELDEKGLFLSSANSINWGRLVPQIVYYVSAYCDLVRDKRIVLGDKIDVCVPTGNFGNIFAAYLAKKMGLPIRKLICASNKNNILTDFINTGVYDRNRDFYTTMSPSMDILISSNLERLLYVLQGSEKTKTCMESLSKTGRYELDEETKKLVKDNFIGCYATEEDTKNIIKQTFDKYNYLVDTHTAVALFAAQKTSENDGTIVVTASTASPYKFSANVLSALGEEVPADDFFAALDKLYEVTGVAVPAPLDALKSKQKRFFATCSKDTQSLWQEVRKFAEN